MNSENENTLIKVNTGLDRLNKLISVTDKLLHHHEIVNNNVSVYDISAYNKRKSENLIIFTFIRRNFWYFIEDIIQKVAVRNSVDTPPPQLLLDCLDINYNYDFSHQLYNKSTQNTGKILSKKECVVGDTKGIKKSSQINEFAYFPYNSFKSAVSFHLNDEIVGQVMHSLSGTSVGKHIGIQVNYR